MQKMNTVGFQEDTYFEDELGLSTSSTEETDTTDSSVSNSYGYHSEELPLSCDDNEAGPSNPGMCDGVNDDVNADHQVQATIKRLLKGSLKAAAAAGGLVLVVAILSGPPGIALGGTVGSFLGWGMTRGQFKPLLQVLRKF